MTRFQFSIRQMLLWVAACASYFTFLRSDGAACVLLLPLCTILILIGISNCRPATRSTKRKRAAALGGVLTWLYSFPGLASRGGGSLSWLAVDNFLPQAYLALCAIPTGLLYGWGMMRLAEFLELDLTKPWVYQFKQSCRQWVACTLMAIASPMVGVLSLAVAFLLSGMFIYFDSDEMYQLGVLYIAAPVFAWYCWWLVGEVKRVKRKST